MLGVHARSVAIGWFVVVISIGSLEAGQTVRGPYEATINRALELLPRLQAKVLVVDATEAARAAELTAVKSRRSSGMERTSCT